MKSDVPVFEAAVRAKLSKRRGERRGNDEEERGTQGDCEREEKRRRRRGSGGRDGGCRAVRGCLG